MESKPQILSQESQNKLKSYKNLLSFAKSKAGYPVFKKSYADLASASSFVKVLVKIKSNTNEFLSFFEVPYNNVVSFESDGTIATLILHDNTNLLIASLFSYIKELTNGEYPIFNVSFGWVDSAGPYKKGEKKPIRQSNDDYIVSTYTVSVESQKEIWTITLNKRQLSVSSKIDNFMPFNLGEDLVRPFFISKAISDYIDVNEAKIKQNKIPKPFNQIEWEKFNEDFRYANKTDMKDFFSRAIEYLSLGSSLKSTRYEYDYVSVSRSVHKHFITRMNATTTQPFLLFNYLCNRMLDHEKQINRESRTKGETIIISFFDASEYEEVTTTKVSLKDFDLQKIKTKKWEELLNDVAKLVKIKLKNTSSKKSMGDITLTINSKYIDKVGDNINQKIELIKDYLNCFSFEDNNFLNSKINQIIRKLNSFKSDENFSYINLIFIFPNFQKLNISEFIDIFDKTPNVITQKYTVNPSKKIGSNFFDSTSTLNEQSFPDVISFKPTYEPVQSITSSIIKTEATSGTTQGSLSAPTVSITSENVINTFHPLNTLISYSSPMYSTSSNYGVVFENFIEAKTTFLKNFRNSGVTLKAEMVIFGEPFFNQFSEKQIFNIWIDVYSYDGTQTVYSGMYNVLKIKHNVSSSKFTTTLTLMKNFETGSEENTLDNIPVPAAQVFIKEKEPSEVKQSEPSKNNEPGVISKTLTSLKLTVSGIGNGISSGAGTALGVIGGVGSSISKGIKSHSQYAGESIRGWINEFASSIETPNEIKNVIVSDVVVGGSSDNLNVVEGQSPAVAPPIESSSIILSSTEKPEKPKNIADKVSKKIASFNDRYAAAIKYSQTFPPGTKVNIGQFFTNEELKKDPSLKYIKSDSSVIGGTIK